jgi:prepilin-type processing-associated H-X9-DG protein
MSGTRATLRNTGTPINRTSGSLAGPSFLGPDDEDEEGEGNPQPQVDPAKVEASLLVGGYGSRHPGGANFLFGDGSVRFLKNTITNKVLHRLANRADGDLVSGDQF